MVASICIFKTRHMPSGQSRVYRVTQLRTDGVHCRESAGTRPVNIINQNAPRPSELPPVRGEKMSKRLLLLLSLFLTFSALVANPKKTTFYGGQSRSLSAEQGGGGKTSLAAPPPSSERVLCLDRLRLYVVVVVVFTLKAVPNSTQYFLTSVLVQLTRTPSVVTG